MTMSEDKTMKLKILKVQAETVGEACKNVKNGAGEKELEYVLAHPDEFPEMKDINWYYFPNAGVGERVPFVSWPAGEFWRDSSHRDSRWDGYDRVVTLEKSEQETQELPEVLEINGIKYKKI